MKKWRLREFYVFQCRMRTRSKKFADVICTSPLSFGRKSKWPLERRVKQCPKTPLTRLSANFVSRRLREPHHCASSGCHCKFHSTSGGNIHFRIHRTQKPLLNFASVSRVSAQAVGTQKSLHSSRRFLGSRPKLRGIGNHNRDA